MNQTIIYASYGITGHEGETVWGISSGMGAIDADRVTVSLPDGYTFCESVTCEVLVEDADGETCPLSMCLSKTGDQPFLYFPTKYACKRVPLTIVSREGWTVRP